VKAWFREQAREAGLLDDLVGKEVLKEEGELDGSVQSTLNFEEE
jgi:hypothetical protein